MLKAARGKIVPVASRQSKPENFWKLASQVGSCDIDRQCKNEQAEGQLSTAILEG